MLLGVHTAGVHESSGTLVQVHFLASPDSVLTCVSSHKEKNQIRIGQVIHGPGVEEGSTQK